MGRLTYRLQDFQRVEIRECSVGHQEVADHQ